MTSEYQNFDAISFYAKHCGASIRKEGKETLFKCPKCQDKKREIYVDPSGKWNCKHAKCASETGCASTSGGPKQFLDLIDPGGKDSAKFEELNQFGRIKPDLKTSDNQAEPATTEKKTWKKLPEMIDSMPKWSNVSGKIGSPSQANGTWKYQRANGKDAFVVVRLDGPKGKIYMQAHAVSGGWQTGGIETSRPLYRLPELLKDSTIPVIVVEGEKCADSLQSFLDSQGFKAFVTTPSQGAQSPGKTEWSSLSGRSVVILPDNDQAGEKFSQEVARLAKEAGAVKISISKPFGKSGSGFDVADQVKAGGHPSIILDTIDQAKPCEEIENEPEQPTNPALALKASSCLRFLENQPEPREFIVDDFLPRLNVGVIAAPGGTGKGYFTLQLALSVATGVKFLGRFKIASPGGVLYCNAEDDEDEIHRRFLGCLKEVIRKAGKEEKENALGALGERFYSPSLTGKHRLTLYPDKEGTNKRDLLNLARAIPDLRLIILDPANRIMAGDFNRVEEVTAFIQSLEEIATDTGATILLVTHTNKASQGGDRDLKHSAGAVLGSQSFVNAARWVMTLSTFDDSMRKKLQFAGPLEKFVSLRIPKANYLAPGLGELHLERVVDETDATGLGSGPLRLVDLGKKEKEVTPEEVAQWVSENPGLTKTATRDAIKGKFGTPKHKTGMAMEEAIKMGLVREEKDKTSGRGQLLFPGFLTDQAEEPSNDD